MSATNSNHIVSILIKCFVLFSFVGATKSLRILGIFPYAGKSHFDVFEPLLLELAHRGHNVTVISHFPQQKILTNYYDISLKGISPEVDTIAFGTIGGSKWRRMRHVSELARLTKFLCETGLKSDEIQKFMQRKEKYDIVLTEFFTTNCFIGLMHFTGGYLIGLTSSGMLPWVNDFIANPDNPSYIPSIYIGHSDEMDYIERTENLIIYLMHKITYKFWIDLPANIRAKKYIDSNLPALNRFAYNASLVLTNIHHVLHKPRPSVPALIEVGGIHIGKNKKLPKHLEKWINESTDGVIFFSMGSMIKGHTFPPEKREMFVRAFARLKQRVLWKWENETLPNKPDNVMIQKWMPQLDILCHPNVKAFITHGGLLSTTEAVHCGVPAVIMPQFGDQYTNARALESSGGGIILHFSTITEEDVYNALKTVLEPSFNKQAKELSVRFKDRPMPPMETAIYWIEYVARHKGAPHLRSAAVGMPFYQYLLLDVIAFLLLVISVLGYVSYIATRYVFRKLLKTDEKEEKERREKKEKEQ